MRYNWIVVLILTLPACATTDHYIAVMAQTAAWERVELARLGANARKYEALAESARGGSDVARVAVAMSLAAQGGYGGHVNPLPPIGDPGEQAYKWASIIFPTATAITSGYFSYKLGAVASNNAAATSISAYSVLGGTASAGFASNAAIAGYIQAPQPNITTTTSNTTNTTSTLSGTGVLGSGSYAVRNCNGGSAGNVVTGNPLAPGGNC